MSNKEKNHKKSKAINVLLWGDDIEFIEKAAWHRRLSLAAYTREALMEKARSEMNG